MAQGPSSLPAGSFVVVFSSVLSGADPEGYARAAARMEELAAEQPGFLGVESARDASGFGLTISYWASREAIAAWRAHPEHVAARRRGREVWYRECSLHVAQVPEEEGGAA